MYKKRKMSTRTKKEIMISVLLASILLLSVAVMILVEDSVGTPVFYDGEMANIQVQITEVCSSNRSIIATDDGAFNDYIELYNKGDSFNLNGFGLANEVGNGVCYTFGDINFPADSYLIVYLDGVNIPFRLSSQGGEYVSLVAYDGTVITSVTTVASSPNEVMLLDGKEYVLSDKASPGYPNTDDGVKKFLASAIDGNMSLTVNEIFTANESLLPDFEGEFCDIIEIKNTSSAIVSTKGYYISDSLDSRADCPLPETELAPGDLLLVYASGKNRIENGEFHSDFRLKSGESVIISHGAKHFSMEVTECEANCSQSRVKGESGFEYTEMYATPGYENDEAGREALDVSRIDADAPIVINEIMFSQDNTAYKGKLRDVIEICNISDGEVSTNGWYISDDERDPYKYKLPVQILEPNECMLLYAESGSGENVCGFALSSGESVYLTTPEFLRSDPVPCVKAGDGKSRSRIIENGETIYTNGEISIGFENSAAGKSLYESSIRPTDVEISEVVALNRSYVAGPYGTYHDFVELHNRTDKDIDLSGWYLSDDPEEPRKGSLESVVIPAKSYIVIILSTDGANIPSGYHRVSFSLSSSGETLVLAKGDEIIDSVNLPSLSTDTAYGRPSGNDGFAVLAKPTPKAENSAAATERAATPTASLAQGVYKENITVELKGEGKIYYTLDCTEPTANSTPYTTPLNISSTTVIRCIALADGKRQSEVCNLTYIVNEGDTIEAMSLVTSPENLWDYYSGIYETGPNASSVFPYDGANYYKRWEREASVTFFSQVDEGFSENCGVRIFGGLSRALPKKSFALFFRSSYGSGDLNYQLFTDCELDRYEALVLRNTGQDFKYSSMRDAMVTSMASDMLGLDVQNCRPVVLYLNGEYWGLYFIREKLNENYVAQHYNVDASKATVTVANGRTSEEYTALVNYASSHDLKVAEHYEYMKSQMDIENYIDYIVAEMIICNTDNGNIRFFTYEGGKWRWIMYDVDHAFRTASYNTVSEHLNPAGTGSSDMFSTRLINALLKNPEFKKKFLTEIAYQMNNIWTEENINTYVDRFKGMIINDIEKDCTRWNRNYSTWESSVDSLKTFGKTREKYMIQYVKSYFSLSDSEMRAYGFNV